jgi:formylmethanofuran dehydrogenase subunit E
MTKRATVILTDTMFAKLSFVAQVEDRLVGEIIREAVKSYVDEPPVELEYYDWRNVDLEPFMPAEPEPEPPEPEPVCAECGAELSHGYQVLEDGTYLCNQCQLKLDAEHEANELTDNDANDDIPPPED